MFFTCSLPSQFNESDTLENTLHCRFAATSQPTKFAPCHTFGAFVTIIQPFQLFAFGAEVSVKLRQLLRLALMVVIQPFKLAVHFLQTFEFGFGVLRAAANAVTQVFLEVAFVGFRGQRCRCASVAQCSSRRALRPSRD